MSPRKAALPHGLLLGWNDPPLAARRAAFTTAVWDEGGEGHLITVAPTGAGKGVGCIIPALLTWRGPAIVIDPKGENVAVTAARRRAMGQNVHVLDPFGVTGCIQPASLNPFDILGHLKSASLDDIRVLAAAAIQQKGFGKNQDPYWDMRATQLITDAIAHCTQHLDKPSLLDVRTVVETYDENSSIDRWGSFPRPCHPHISHPFLPRGMATDKTRLAITSTAVDHLAFVTEGAVANSLWRSTIPLKKVLRGDAMTIYIVVPPDKLHTHNKLLRLWLITLLTTLSKRDFAPAAPTLLIVDEAAQLGEVKQLTSAVTLMRGYGMKVWSFWQDLSQLKKVYPEDWHSILNNSAFHQYFGASTPMATRELQEYLADTCPRPVASFSPNHLALYRPGTKGSVARVPNYLTDAMFQGLFDPNPFHPARTARLDLGDDTPYELEEKDSGVVLHFPARGGRDD